MTPEEQDYKAYLAVWNEIEKLKRENAELEQRISKLESKSHTVINNIYPPAKEGGGTIILSDYLDD